MKVFLGVLLLFASSCHISGLRTSNQEPTAYCTKLTATNQLQFEFILDHKNDSAGTLRALTSTGNLIPQASCIIGYNSATKIYTMTSLVSLSNFATSFSNGCGYTFDNGQVYTWKIKYFEHPNFLTEDTGLNRLYTVSCNMSETRSDRTDAQLIVNTPNIDETVTVSNPVINLFVMYQDGAVYRKATTLTQISASTNIKLRLEVTFGTFKANEVFAVAGLHTEVASNINFAGSTTILAANTGCPITGSQLTPTTGFISTVGTTAVNPWVSETGVFQAYTFQSGSLVAFRVTYVTCRASTFNGNPVCVNTCSHFQNNGRRRRDVQDDDLEPKTATVTIRIKKDSKQEEQTSEANTMVYVGSGVAVGVAVVLLCVVVCFVLMRKRARRDGAEKRSTKVPPEGFTNNMHY